MNIFECIWATNSLVSDWIKDFFTFHLWSFLKTEKDLIASLGSIITAFTAVAGVWFGLKNLRSLKENSEAMKEDSEAQTRPYVQASLALGVQLNGSVDLILENRGNSTADNISLHIEGFTGTDDKNDYIKSGYETKVLPKKYSLAPQTKYRWMWASFRGNSSNQNQQILNEKKEIIKELEPGDQYRKGFCEEVTLRVDYQSAKGVFRTIQRYTETYTLDAEGVVALAPQPFEGTTKTSTSQSADKSLANINEALRTLNIHTGMKNY